jgi:DNA-binding beta-propeller fold protein YncE
MACASAYGQVSSSAYRVLGQTNFAGNSVNLVQGSELNSPAGIALDTRGKQVHVYISDTLNNRILAWADVNSYQIGNPPAIILGQSSAQSTNPLAIGSKGLNAPLGMVVDPNTGNLYVADYGDNRVLRFPRHSTIRRASNRTQSTGRLDLPPRLLPPYPPLL